MALFQFEYFRCEIPEAQWLFSHENKTPEEFRADCHQALNDVGEKYINSNAIKGAVSGYYWFEEAVKMLQEWGYKLLDIPRCRLWLPAIFCEYDEDQCAAISQDLFRKAVEKQYELDLAYYGEDAKIEPPSWMKGDRNG